MPHDWWLRNLSSLVLRKVLGSFWDQFPCSEMKSGKIENNKEILLQFQVNAQALNVS